MSATAILKHIAVKSSNYAKMQQYLLFKHDPRHRQPILDDEGRMIFREAFIMGGINCDPFNFDTDCIRLNRQYGKNCEYGEIKAHHYIISFDPRDQTENGLTPDKVQAIGMEFAQKFFAGHQVLVVTHTDGHNHSGNLHVHIVLNSLRMLDEPRQDFMERDIDTKAGYKHHVTRQLLGEMQQELNAICVREHLNTVDFLLPTSSKTTEAEYWAKQRGQAKLDAKNEALIEAGSPPRKTVFRTDVEMLREAIDRVLPKVKSWEDYARVLEEKYHIQVRKSRGTVSYLLPGRKRPIRGKRLGRDYEDRNVELLMGDPGGLPYVLTMPSDLRLVVDLQTCVKAQRSLAYARKVTISNIQNMARTVSWLQRNHFGSLQELEEKKAEFDADYRDASVALRETESRLKETNATIHHLGSYLSRKKLYAQFLNAPDKAAFRTAHATDIDRYEESARWLKEHYGETGFPKMDTLKAAKAKLQAERDQQKEDLKPLLKVRRTFQTMDTNVRAILGMPLPEREKPQPVRTRESQPPRRKRSEPSL